MIKYKVGISKAAEEDIDKIAEYYAVDLQNPEGALKLISILKDAVLSLSEMPQRHQLVFDEYLAIQGIRMFPVQKYLVFYTVNSTDCIVNIVRVLYEKREWEPLLKHS